MHLIPMRDEAGAIIGLRRPGETQDGASVPSFSATLSETIAAVGTPDAPKEEPAASPTIRPHLAMLAAGLVAALILVAGLNLMRTPTDQSRPVALPPSPAALPTRTRVPTAAPTPTSAPTATLDPPTPIVIIQPPPPIQCYTITLDVTDAHGTPIGIATGESCQSREAAQANAETEAAQVRATYEKR